MAQDDKLMIPIHYAVLKNDLPMVAWLIRFKAEDIAMRAMKMQVAPIVPGSGDRGKRKLSKGKTNSPTELQTPKRQTPTASRRNSSMKASRPKEKATAE